MPPGWVPLSGACRVELLFSVTHHADELRLHVGPRLLARTSSIDEVCDELEAYQDLVLAAVAPERWFVHACVVGTPAGALLVPGPSGSGKTTLTEALLRAGAEYFSDDLAALDAQGLVHPYPRPLSIRRQGHRLKLRVRPESLGWTIATTPLVVKLVAITHYENGATFCPSAVAPAQGVLGLLGNMLAARTEPRKCLDVLTKVAASARFIGGPRGDASTCAEALLRELQAS